jgi:signal recognition particle subunit SRP54
MGDVVSLVEKAQEQVSQEDAEALQEKMAKGEMTMDDFLSQLKTLRRMGPMKQLLGLLPGVGSALKDVHIEDKQLDKVEAMISSMTKGERASPSVINNPRRRRIATGSGSQQEEVGAMVKQFEMVSKLTKSMASMSAADRVKAVKGMGSAEMSMLPGMSGMPGLRTKGSSAAPSIKAKFKKRKK